TVVAAQRVGPQGAVLAIDLSASMLDLARQEVRAAGLQNVEARVMDAQRLELEPGSFDAAIARFSLQFVPDVPRALTEVRRVLKAGGRLTAGGLSAPARKTLRVPPPP